MRLKLYRYTAVFLLLFAIGGLITAKPCQAASADVVISADSTEVTLGDSIFVYINIDSDTKIGDFEANITYDDDLLEYTGNSPVITGDSGFLKVSDRNVMEGDNTRKYTMEFNTLQVGICKFSFSGRAMVYDLDNGNEMSVSVNELTLNVKAAETASTNTNLKSMKISPSELSPAFDPGIYDYQANVDYETEQLVITAIPEDPKSTVSITGNDFLKEGENKVVISVLAESGDIIEYNINVLRENAPAEPTAAAAVTSVPAQNSFEFVEVDGVNYAVYSGKYILTQPGSDIAVPDGYELGSLKVSGITIPAYLPADNKESEFILIYATNEYGDSGFYQYDRIEKTLQRFDSDNMIINSSHKGDSADTQEQKYHDNLTKAVIAIALLSAFCTLMVFVTIRMLFKLKGYKEDDLD